MSNSSHKFGGPWTQQKLSCLKDYLSSYMTIFTANEAAKHLKPHYIDVFAGTGHWVAKGKTEPQSMSLNLLTGFSDVIPFQEGSVTIALEQDPPFQKYIFVDIDEDHVNQLQELTIQYPHLESKIEIFHMEANKFLQNWCSKMEARDRAVLFLDPYGASVKWETIKKIAETEAIDMWMLFPLGSAVNRMLPRNKLPNDAFSKKLDEIFGTDDWQDHFYKVKKELQPSMFGDDNSIKHVKDADFKKIGKFFEDRLKSVFAGVATPKALYNSRNNPLYLLCFAAGNPKGQKTALRIANHLLGKI